MNDGEGNPLACTCGIRGPKPYGKRHAFFNRSAGACPPRKNASEYRSAGACPPRSLGYADDAPTSVVREHPLPNRSGSGDPELQKERGRSGA